MGLSVLQLGPVGGWGVLQLGPVGGWGVLQLGVVGGQRPGAAGRRDVL